MTLVDLYSELTDNALELIFTRCTEAEAVIIQAVLHDRENA